MLRALLAVVEALLISLIGYNLLTSLFGWRNPGQAPIGRRERRMRVVIPAHNEETVIGGVLGDLSTQELPTESYEVWVLADRCTDNTVKTARQRGATVAERMEGPDGKGAALSWYLDTHPLEVDEALVILDADNRVDADLLSGISDVLEQGHQAVQVYVDVANPDASAVAAASALSYWASNRMVQLARHNLGWQVDLAGTGMCLTAQALNQVGGFGSGATEDQDLTVRLLLAGVTVRWCHSLRVRDEKPTSPGVAVRQRGRWASGRRQVARRFVADLLTRPTPSNLDLAIRLVQPSRTGVALVSAALAGASWLGAPLLPATVWATLAGVQFLAPIPFLARDGVPGRYLLRYPLMVILAVFKVPARLVRQRGWYHTPHSG